MKRGACFGYHSAKRPPAAAVYRERNPMQTILVANPKGGSGKTTLATNIAG